MSQLADKWRLPARRDEVLETMVPSDIRQLVGEIDRLEIVLERIATQRMISHARRIARETLAGKPLGHKAGNQNWKPF